MSDNLSRLCVFGDSHYACLRQAQSQGLVDLSGIELEYWGHVGARFRRLEARDGAIYPTDDFTARRFAKLNKLNRMFLPAADFDAILVVGARIYVAQLFLSLMHAHCHGPFVSDGLRRRMLKDRLRGQRGYPLAAGLAKSGTARILLSPVPFFTENHPTSRAQVTPEVAAIGRDVRDEYWEILRKTAEEDGIVLIQQPEVSVVRGIYTDVSYAVPDYAKKRDYEHHNAAYGALIFSEAIAKVRQMAATPALPGLAAETGGLQDGRK
jgi:hypothetical protein